MKNSIFLVSFCLVFLLTSCPGGDTGGGSGVSLPPPIKLKIKIVNNSSSGVNFSLKRARIGADGLENIEQIFNEDSMRTFEHFKENYSITEVFEEYDIPMYWDDQHEKQDNWDRVKLEGTVLSGKTDTMVCYYNKRGYSISSVLLRLNFDSNEERVIAGWPKYYYSKLANVVKYGFFYSFVNYDKKIREFIDNGGSGAMFSIDSDDPSGEITGYKFLTVYSLRLTINSVDDIILEVVEDETGKTFEVIREPLPDDMS